ncbi:MMPL family transporter [Kocuria marina]|uniref:MMPL family transporter n=1 Tax=Kocuria marina TaxID=223184 RepID=UPI002989F294|nr:MMPL family transporter [Kocuria marina]MCT1723846.1 MMPL family transporter [Kocuria marina]MCT1735117.1 MMPL family transporter [Kocuria marina]
MPSSPTRPVPEHAEDIKSAGPDAGGKRPGWVRRLIPVVLVLAWLGVMGVGGPTFGKLSDVVSNSQTDFLPVDSQATQVQDRLGEFQDSDGVPAIVVMESENEITPRQLRAIGTNTQALGEIQDVLEVSPPIPSEDGKAVEIIALVSSEADTGTVVEHLRERLAEDTPEGLSVAVTGPAGLVADLSAAFAGIDGLLLIVALVAVLVILVIVYRSPLLPFLVLLTSVGALCGAIITVYFLAQQGWIDLSGQTQGIMSIVVIGAATDYGLLYTARFREALHHTPSRWTATRMAWKGTVPAVLASGTTVIAGLLCLLFSALTSNRGVGPATAMGVVFAILAGLTLLPALLALFGRVALWPKMPRVDENPETHEQAMNPYDHKGLWPSVARLVDRRSRAVWLACAVVLGAAAVGASQLDADGVPQSEFVLGESEARDGLAVIERHFPGGAGDPVYVLAPQEDAQAVAERLSQDDDVASVAFTAQDSPNGTLPYPTPQGGPLANAEPTVSNGDVLIQATLTYASDSEEAQATVTRLRDDLAGITPGSKIGGTTAVQVDTIAASERDRALIIPIILAVILLILMVLLRSILMPVLLIATTVLSFVSALGVATLVFHLMDINQADPTVPLFSFVFLVALGIDYNIFLMSRVREEVVTAGHRKGVLAGLITTGGVITSAGIVLAATFAALAVLPILFLVQLAIIVTIGVLMDTIIVRSLLVPALALDIGPRSWWPSRVGTPGKHRALPTTPR